MRSLALKNASRMVDRAQRHLSGKARFRTSPVPCNDRAARGNFPKNPSFVVKVSPPAMICCQLVD